MTLIYRDDKIQRTFEYHQHIGYNIYRYDISHIVFDLLYISKEKYK